MHVNHKLKPMLAYKNSSCIRCALCEISDSRKGCNKTLKTQSKTRIACKSIPTASCAWPLMFDDISEWRHILYVIIGGFIARLIYDNYYEKRHTQSVTHSRIQHGNPEDEWTAQETIPDGKAGTVATLKYMRAIVNRDSNDAYIRKTAEQVVKGCRGHDFMCEIKALFEFVRDHITYRRDPITAEYVQDTRRTLESGVGDCDCKVVALCSLLQSLGHKTRFVVIGNRPDEYSHVYCEVLTRQHGWMPLDPTNERATVGWEAQAAVKGAFPVWVN